MGLEYDFHVRVEQDPEASPDEYDCYSDADKTTWKQGEWRFVTLTVIPEDENGVLMEDSAEILGAVEYGVLPGGFGDLPVEIDRDELEDLHIIDMAHEAVGATDKNLQ